MSWEPYRGHAYWDFDQVRSWCEAMAQAHPEWVRVREIGRTRHERPILLCIFGRAEVASEARPAVWIDAGTHASEWTGVSAALAVMSSWAEGLAGGDEALRAWFEEHHALVAPCVSPDGYQALFEGEPYLRSSLRPPRHGAPRAGFEARDIDGDGAVRWMRWRHPAGPLVPEQEGSTYMRPRTLEDDPSEAYFLCDEGEFIHWDGVAWSSAPRQFGVDLNRNFPAHWEPFSMFGMDGGAYPLSEPETRAIVDAFEAHPLIGAALTFHTYTGCILTSPYRQDSKLDRPDIDLMYEMAKDLVEGTGYRTFKVCPDFMYDPKKPTVGVWSETMTTVFGVPGFTVEFWDPYAQADVEIEKPAAFFLDPDYDKIRALVEAFEDQPEAVTPWRPFEHPQLGEVEIGGLDYLRTIRNPPEARLAGECDIGRRMADRLRRALPQVQAHLEVEPAGAGAWRVALVLENRGFLSTSGLARGQAVGAAPGVWASLEPGEGAALVGGPDLIELEHLPGWGNARVGAARHPVYAGLPGTSPRQLAQWVVTGQGQVTVRWSAGRGGAGQRVVALEAT